MSARDDHANLDWPPWVPGIFGLIALGTGVAVVVQRAGVGYYGLALPIAAVSLVLLPYALETVLYFMPPPVAPPRVAWIAYPLCVLVGTTLLVAYPTPTDFSPFFLVLISAQMAAERERWQGIVVAVAGMTLMVAVDVLKIWDLGSFIWLIGIGLGWFGGFSVSLASRQAIELKRANAELAVKSAAEERQRIAREVHDVIAHSMSVTMLHVTAARMALEKSQTPEALDSLREAERQGRNSLNDLRRTVGLLGSDQSATEPPMPGATDLPKLITDFRSAGLDVTLGMDGDVHALEPGTGLNVYRIVQESLTNAAKHAPGAKARVELNVTDTDIRLRIQNGPGNGSAPPPSGSGLGLRGMIERAAMIGGTLGADSDESGWTVLLVAPRVPA